ncbi:MAG: adenylosuccinate synthetase [Candidatus Paceibacterota bacterium]|jgi:adenylosuccinate synthase
MKEERIFIVAGLGFGDEGKGSIVDYLARRYDIKSIVRYNGGPQAAHYVVNSDGYLHCFAQYGSGTFSGASTYLFDKVMVDPVRLGHEANSLAKKGVKRPLWLVSIDPDCLIVTPFHGIINQMLEISRGNKKHGSCGFGVGEAVKDGRNYGEMALRAKDLSDPETLQTKLDFLWRMKTDIAEQIASEQPENSKLQELLGNLKDEKYVGRLASYYSSFSKALKIGKKKGAEISGSVVFEGAQGVLLDEKRGFYPHITHSCTTFANAEELIGSMGLQGKVVKIGVIRAYSTRHGAGPFVTYNKWLTGKIPDTHNITNEWQGEFRIGWFDLVASRYALRVAGKINCVALTNLDRLDFEKIRVCEAYEYCGKKDASLQEYFEFEETSGKIMIKNINFPAKTSSEHQGKLAELLKLCRPIYQTVKKAEYIHFLESELKIKIAIASYGEKAEDKVELRPLLQ